MLILIIISIGLLLFLASYVLNVKNIYFNKLSIYECGFRSMSHEIYSLVTNYIVVGIVFMLFDLEILLLFPWCTTLFYINIFSLYSFILIIIFIILGLIYELHIGALIWV